MKQFNDKKYLGIIEDNNDPDRQNKCRIRVINVFDGLPVEDLPWAVPFKDHNGLACNLPDVGKVVAIEFENGDIYNPIYKYGEHYNVNLQEKLDTISDEDYLSMKSLLFDHVTQIYTNESEGLKLDHKFNLFNITDSTIDLGLKDNYGSVNIGTADASQQAILGNHFLDWFSTFVDHLLGSQGGPFFGNLLAPIVPHPGFISHLLQYKALKEPKFLSHNINFNDNGYVDRLSRVNTPQKGDTWKSTTEDNNLTKSNIPTGFEPSSGNKDTTPNGQLTSSEEVGNNGLNSGNDIEMPDIGETNEDVLILIKVLKNKGYRLFDKPYEMNIIGVRFQYPGEKYTNRFSDKLYTFYIDNNNEWNIKKWNISTMPGTKIRMRDRNTNALLTEKYSKFKEKVDPKSIPLYLSLKKYVKYLGRTGLGILQPSQYINTFKLSTYSGAPALKSVGNQYAYRDSNWDSDIITYSSEDGPTNFVMHLHKAFPGGSSVNNWSEGCQVFPTDVSIKSFAKLCDMHIKRNSNQFSYTLITSNDFDVARTQIQNLSDQEKEDIGNSLGNNGN